MFVVGQARRDGRFIFLRKSLEKARLPRFVKGPQRSGLRFPESGPSILPSGSLSKSRSAMGAIPQTLEPLWRPHRDQITNSNLTRFQGWLRSERGLNLEDHCSLYDWSVRDPDGFWCAIAEFFGVRFHTAAERALHRDPDPLRTEWFPGGTLNYAEHLLRFGLNEVPVSDDRLAVLYCAETGTPDRRQLATRKDLVEQVAQLASALTHLGVRRGDRVAGYLPNR